ncbi:MAG: hypothetical protein R3F08_08285 [Dokdonella sp.]|nr:hypothetical protein [Dokdonella sp.]MCB1570839.1 hypothetical protein [Xanthomonadales bacterium]MCB1575369.1 hypothetical protein [Xanthomonadales bacterium]MCB1576616.1 hypothetical protein [Xanthomonadales bacterium]
MTAINKGFAAAGLALAIAAATAPSAQAAEAQLDCSMRFSLTGWSAIYKHAEGSGVVTCENGQSMKVKISAKGGGLTVGKSHIDDGKGEFTDVHKMSDILGTYAQGEATAAAGKSATAQVLTKGTVSLALAGTGEGVDLGISFGGFTISKAD